MMPKVKLCYKCKEYIWLHPDNFLSKDMEKSFDAHHSPCPTQIVNEAEFRLIQNEYKQFIKPFMEV